MQNQSLEVQKEKSNTTTGSTHFFFKNGWKLRYDTQASPVIFVFGYPKV